MNQSYYNMNSIYNSFTRMAMPELEGKHLFIPEYQRGYRWQERQIMQLLSDLNDFRTNSPRDSFYCLQPIVVKPCDAQTIVANGLDEKMTWYEVIDGQQRLTTLHLIMTFSQLTRKVEHPSDAFTIYYKTRPNLGKIFGHFRGHYNAQGYLDGITLDEQSDSMDIDSFHIYQAMLSILRWFTENGPKYEKRLPIRQFTKMDSLFQEEKDSGEHSIQIIWYELNDDTNPRDMFNRLNNDKIQLTNSELIRAIFLSDSTDYGLEEGNLYDDAEKKVASDMNKQRKQAHIVEEWDAIEHKLREKDKRFWAFLTNREREDYQNCIELIFDFISKKYATSTGNNKITSASDLRREDELYTFLYFDRLLRSGEKSPWQLWLDIENCYAILCNWFEDYELYHKIGYLTYYYNRQRQDIIPVLLDEAISMSKSDFMQKCINNRIAETIKFDFEQLNYLKNAEPILMILALYNIELHRTNISLGRMPFQLFKSIPWTLEHIHAQNSEGIDNNKRDVWDTWLDENIKMLTNFKLAFAESETERLTEIDRLIANMQACRNKQDLRFKEVEMLFNTVLDFFDTLNADKNEPSDMHKLSNLTLLSSTLNTRVGNMVFEGKRQCIVEADATGSEYISIGTKRVFLKYVNHAEPDFDVQQLYFWGKRDRKNYEKEISQLLAPYVDVKNKNNSLSNNNE